MCFDPLSPVDESSSERENLCIRICSVMTKAVNGKVNK